MAERKLPKFEPYIKRNAIPEKPKCDECSAGNSAPKKVNKKKSKVNRKKYRNRKYTEYTATIQKHRKKIFDLKKTDTQQYTQQA